MDKVSVFLGIVVVVLLVMALVTYPFMWAWNYGMVVAFPMLGTLEPLQAFSVLVVFAFMKSNTSNSK
jgi:hypothetical protein